MGTGIRIGSGHTSAGFRTGAELFRVEQRSVFSREVTIGTRRIDSSRGIGDHLRIQEVSLQTGVIRVQQARATDHGERYDVLVVGLQNSESDEFILALTNPRTADLAHPSAHPARFQQPAYETAITRQLFQCSATDDELPSPHRPTNPGTVSRPESASGRTLRTQRSHRLWRTSVIDHPLQFVPEETSVSFRCIKHVAFVVNAN